MNPSKAKGTAAETLAVRWFRAHGFPMSDRQPLRGNRDTGDLDLCPGLVVEVKAHKLPTGHPTSGQIATWMAQSQLERVNAGASYCPLVVKRPGTTDVGRWFAFITFADLAILTGAFVPRDIDTVPVSLPVSALAAVLRSAGYGDPLEAAA
jgi:hypothetical protein